MPEMNADMMMTPQMQALLRELMRMMMAKRGTPQPAMDEYASTEE